MVTIEQFHAVLERYASSTTGIADICKEMKVRWPDFYGMMKQNEDTVQEAREMRAIFLHDLATSQLDVEPERFIDLNGVTKIDPSSVQLIKMRADHAARIAAHLSTRFLNKSQLTISSDPFAALLKKIEDAGSSVPLCTDFKLITDDDDDDDDNNDE